MSKTQLEGKVAQILNEQEIAINIGQQDGVKRGMIFAVLDATPTEVHDPDTEEVLGIVDREKVRVRATEVQERLTICGTYETTRISAGAAYGMGDLLAPPREVVKTLRASAESFPRPISPSDSYVKAGDRVRAVEE